MYKLRCSTCDQLLDGEPKNGECAHCHGVVDFIYDMRWEPESKMSSMWRYKSLLPVPDEQHIVSLGEGMTPLLKSRMFADQPVYLKDETRNPTGSMKDRAISVSISKALQLGYRRIITSTAGGLGISVSAYANRAGLECVILIPQGISQERITAMQIYGSEVIEVQGTFDDCVKVLEQLVHEPDWYDTTTYRRANPYQGEGPKTIAYEIYEQLGDAPDYVVVPIGGGGTLGGIYRGFQDLHSMGLVTRIPRMYGVQNEKFNGIEIALQNGWTMEEQLKDVDIDMTASTVTGAIKHSFVPDGVEVLAVLRDTHGTVITVSDDEAMSAQAAIAMNEGLFIEPTSGVVVAALAKLREQGSVDSREQGVLVLTGSGYRELGLTTDYHGQAPRKYSIEECYGYLSGVGARK